jgi:serine phosphatase RsbU (regulator of sigma subunit)
VSGSLSNTARVAWICTAALAVFVVWVATAAKANTGIGFFYVVPIGLAAWWFGGRAAAIAVASCCVLYNIGGLIQPIPHFGLSLAVRLIIFIGVAVIVSFLRAKFMALEHSAEELETIQAALIPSSLPELLNADVGAAFVPSEYGVTGDFYLITNGPDESSVAVVGDVVGHGPEAARLATFIRARFAAFTAATSDPGELLTLTNEALSDRPHPHNELVSAVCLRIRAGETKLSWAVAGHPPPLLLPSLQEQPTAGSTYLLGAEASLRLPTAEVAVGDNEGVLIYTDGATDVRREGVLLGVDGLSRLLRPLVALPAKSLARKAEEAILDWTDEPIRDDLCVFVLRPKHQGH